MSDKNKVIQRKRLKDITKTTFKQAIYLAYKDGITSRAPLGYRGDTIIIYQSPQPFSSMRSAEVSINNHNGDAKLLITDLNGSFIFYGGFDSDLGLEFVASQYWIIFNYVKDKIETVMPSVSRFTDMKIDKRIKPRKGFNMLVAHQK